MVVPMLEDFSDDDDEPEIYDEDDDDEDDFLDDVVDHDFPNGEEDEEKKTMSRCNYEESCRSAAAVPSADSPRSQ